MGKCGNFGFSAEGLLPWTIADGINGAMRCIFCERPLQKRVHQVLRGTYPGPTQAAGLLRKDFGKDLRRHMNKNPSTFNRLGIFGMRC